MISPAATQGPAQPLPGVRIEERQCCMEVGLVLVSNAQGACRFVEELNLGPQIWDTTFRAHADLG